MYGLKLRTSFPTHDININVERRKTADNYPDVT